MTGLFLYTVMILYMLDNLEFPMTTSQLSEFFVNKGYTSCINLKESDRNVGQEICCKRVGRKFTDQS